MRTLLMLGGSDTQLHAIRRAKELGLQVITCDDRPANPGHALADEYHEVSTTDVGGVLELASRRRTSCSSRPPNAEPGCRPPGFVDAADVGAGMRLLGTLLRRCEAAVTARVG